MTSQDRALLHHVLRGLLGVGALGIALGGSSRIGWPALLPLPLAVWAFRGCPMCWLLGLIDALALRTGSRLPR